MPRQAINLFITIHLIASCFCMPGALLFLVTGACYTMDIKGSYHTVQHTLPLDAPLQPDLDACRAMTVAFLEAEGVTPPSGGDRIRRFGTSFAYEWHGSNRDVLLSPTDDPAQARMEIRNTTFFRRMVQLHKAKGGALFKWYALAFSAALMITLMTGVIVAWQRRSLRIQALVASGLGILLFLVLVLLS